MNPSEFHWLIDWLIDLIIADGSKRVLTRQPAILYNGGSDPKNCLLTLDQACAPSGAIGISMVGHVINIL